MATLPTIEPQGPDEPIAYFGARIVRWLLADGCSVTLTDEQIELAEYAAAIASTTRGYLLVTYDKLSTLRHELAATTARRKALQADSSTQPASPEYKPDLGPMARLQPTQPYQPTPGEALAEPAGRQYDRIAF